MMSGFHLPKAPERKRKDYENTYRTYPFKEWKINDWEILELELHGSSGDTYLSTKQIKVINMLSEKSTFEKGSTRCKCELPLSLKKTVLALELSCYQERVLQIGT
ncbi:hypothetical protein Tco_1200535 [Tanacetum coccineum]